jgi:hypothetical protein
MTNALIDEDLRVCSDCAEIKPLTEFRRRYRDREDRMYQCRECHAAAERCRRKHHRSIRTGRRMQALATSARRTKDLNRLITLLKVGISASGGFENLLKDWHAAVQDSIDRGISTPRLLGFYETMTALVVRHGRRTPTNTEFTDLYGKMAGR